MVKRKSCKCDYLSRCYNMRHVQSDCNGDHNIYITAIIVCLFIIAFVIVIAVLLNGEGNDMGTAICREQYGQDTEFKHYSTNKEVVCSTPPEIITDSFDGIKTKLWEGEQ